MVRGLFVSAAIHGDEICGVEIIRRLLARKSLARLRGTLFAVPIVNVYGFLNHSRYLPDRRDLNRSFPGSETGSLTSRLARIFMREVVEKVHPRNRSATPVRITASTCRRFELA